MIEFLLKRPIAVIMSIIALIILGLIASVRLPVSLMPDIDIPEISVYYTLDNASVQEMENSVTGMLRAQLQQIPDLTDIRSESGEGSGNITMKFEYGTSLDYAFIEVNQRVDAVSNSLPAEMNRPNIIKASTSDLPVFYIQLYLRNEASEQRFLEFCEFTEAVLKKRLEQLPEVAMVDVSGAYTPELYILLDESRLRSLQLNQEEIKSAIDNNNQISGSLSVRDGYYQYSIKFATQLSSAEELGEVYLNVNGRLLQVKDVAEVGIRPRDKRGVFIHNNQQALSLAVIKQSSARMSTMKERVTELLELFEKDYPEIEYEVSRDQAMLLNYSLDNLKQSLVLGIILAIVSMLFFLRDARSPLIIAISIPVSVVITILFFQLFGLTINTISLSGLILGVGMMVDNSIIVIDNINQYRQRGESLFQSCLRGTQEIIRPLLSSVLTTCAIFIPLIFLSGIAGALFYDQAMAVTIGLFVSFFVSITLIPVIFHLLFLRREQITLDRFIQRISIKNLDVIYTRIFYFLFKRRGAVLLICLAALVAGGLAASGIRLERMPEITTHDRIVKIDWNNSIHVEENEGRVRALFAAFEERCEEISCFVGEKQFLLNREKNQHLNEAEFYLRTADARSLEEVVTGMHHYIKQKYPEANVNIYETENLFEQLFRDNDVPLVAYVSNGSRREIVSLDTITQLVHRLNRLMPALDIDLPSTTERLVIEILPERLALYRVNQSHLINTLEKNINKMNIGKLNTGNRYIPIVITSEERTIREIVENSFVINDKRLDIPVSALVRMNKELDYKAIYGRKEGVAVPLNIYHTGDSVQHMMKVIRREATANGQQVAFGGKLFSGKDTLWEMVLVIVVSILMLYFILAAQFESLTLPLIILVEIPLDVAVTVSFLWLSGISLNLMSMIGIVVMCGIVINDSILKIDTIVRLQRSGLPLTQAMHEGGVRRLKPILMTSLTTILALVPMLWGNDIGSQLQRPMAITLIVGMLVGTFVSLFIIPLFYYEVQRWGSKKFVHKGK